MSCATTTAMIAPKIFVWLQTTTRRDSNETRASIEASDIGKNYAVVTDTTTRRFPGDYPELQSFWSESWREMVLEAKRSGATHILRLEDDVVVNKHILHNLKHWRAVQSPLFGLGALFVPNYWRKRMYLFKNDKNCPDLPGQPRVFYRNVLDVEGGQGQLMHVDQVHPILDCVPKARAERGLDKPHHPVSFDWALSRAAYCYKQLRTFVHIEPCSLVDLHMGSIKSQIDLTQHMTGKDADPNTHYWGNESFNATWRAPD